MKAVIVDTFDNFNLRTKYVYDYLVDMGYSVKILSSDFDHLQKKKKDIVRNNTIFIKTKPYTKNISIRRIYSHLDFSKKVYKLLMDIKPDIIYCMVPLNSLLPKIFKYLKYNTASLYVDIFDLWPESLPTNNFIKKLLFVWRNMRDKYLSYANKVFLECSYYTYFLPKLNNYIVAYLARKPRIINFQHIDRTINFLYLGSINNIIDIDGIVELLNLVGKKRPVFLNIIGGGEAELTLINKLKKFNIPYYHYGKLFDEYQKDVIISKCHFGINMYKKGLSIGLTMKSLDYFCRGLPILSRNIYDTGEIIKQFDCGIDIASDFSNIGSLKSLTELQWKQLAENTNNAFLKYFSTEKYIDLLQEHLGK